MKVTKRQLKKIIKEEIEATMQEQGGDKMAKAQELAQVLAQSPAIMDFVREAAQNPEVQAVAEEGESKLAERHDPALSQVKAISASAMGLGAAALHVNLMGQIGMVSAAKVAAAGALGLPVAAGLIAVAVGILVYRTIKGPPVSER